MINYRIDTTLEGYTCLIVYTENNTICFAWDPSDLENYGVFIQKLEQDGIETFVQLLANNPNTAFEQFTTVTV